jgi:hypothetical protein
MDARSTPHAGTASTSGAGGCACTHATAATTSSPPVICAASASPWTIQAISAASDEREPADTPSSSRNRAIGEHSHNLPYSGGANGAWRSLVARMLWVHEVPGSNPGAPIDAGGLTEA